ncbi:hypothetical protein [Agaribacter marinus]|uniref:Sel1 repeat-containing protein n=1 Tax=Agaribacter marinus TaxID=1431249 RepID=A0AA37WGV5_9ALTE|nr:hypothetical protein [Agaribacter marinus]GLR69332.1 hypothetical protein GCM10007852_02400 [Agaribacter marinus]
MSMFKSSKSWLIVAAYFFIVPAYANGTSTFIADEFYKNGEYLKAKQAYAEIAPLGSPHAYYQLGRIHYEGLGTEQDLLSAIVYFSLAAEYQFIDAEKAAMALLTALPASDQIAARKLVSQYKEKYGKAVLASKYFPEIKHESLANTLSFGGEGILQIDYRDPELFLDDFSVGVTTFDDEFGFFEDDNYLRGSDNSSAQPFSREKQFEERTPNRLLRDLEPFIIVDYDLAPDGSIRNIREVDTFGYNIPRLLQQLSRHSAPAPVYDGKRTYFTGRAFLGIAAMTKWEVQQREAYIFSYIKRKARQLKKSEDIEDLFQYAVALQNFRWLPQAENESIEIMEKVAKTGHVIAQFELGARMYREQRDIPKAIEWIIAASQHGYAPAAYMLGHILQNSPWVINDEKKALFWYQRAATEGSPHATLKAAELLLLAKNAELHDVEQAQAYLRSIETSQEKNPEYYFLRAVARKNASQRDMQLVVKDIQKAISRGKTLHWDVSYWESLLDAWTTGRVLIKDL